MRGQILMPQVAIVFTAIGFAVLLAESAPKDKLLRLMELFEPHSATTKMASKCSWAEVDQCGSSTFSVDLIGQRRIRGARASRTPCLPSRKAHAAWVFPGGRPAEN